MDFAITIDPDLLDRAAVWFMAGQMAEAEHLCQQVLQRQPDHPDALRQLGLVRLVSGDPASALTILLPLQGNFVKDPDLAIALAEAAWAAQEVAAAIPHYRRALALAPGRVRARVRFGMALLTVGLASEARQELELAATVQPDGRTLGYLGMALLGEGRAADAIPVLQRAARLEPGDASSSFILASRCVNSAESTRPYRPWRRPCGARRVRRICTWPWGTPCSPGAIVPPARRRWPRRRRSTRHNHWPGPSWATWSS